MATNFRMVELFEAPGSRMVRLLGSPRCFVWFDYKTPPGFRMVGLSEVPRYSYVWTFRGIRFPYGWTLRGLPVFVLLDS